MEEGKTAILAILILVEISGENQLFRIYEFEGISSNVVNCSMIYNTRKLLIMNFNNPHIFQIKEISMVTGAFL